MENFQLLTFAGAGVRNSLLLHLVLVTCCCPVTPCFTLNYPSGSTPSKISFLSIISCSQEYRHTDDGQAVDLFKNASDFTLNKLL